MASERGEKEVMEFQSLSPPSKVDREYRELEKRVREELCAIFGLSMRDCLRVMREKADERAGAAGTPKASATVGACGDKDEE